MFCIHQGAWPDLALTRAVFVRTGRNVLTKDLPARSWGMAVRGIRRAWVEKYEGRRFLTAFDPPASS
ncbi:MAG: hypothetical protein ACLR9W_09640 [Enterobacter hormaechei]